MLICNSTEDLSKRKLQKLLDKELFTVMNIRNEEDPNIV